MAEFPVGSPVVVSHEQGVELGGVRGTQTDPVTGAVFVVVQFADRTVSVWPAERVEAA